MGSPKLGRSLVCWKNGKEARGPRGGIRGLRCETGMYFCSLTLYSPHGRQADLCNRNDFMLLPSMA